MSSDNCCIDEEKWRLALSSVSGALVDAGVVVPAEEWRYGDAVREITKERDALRARVAELEAQLAVEEVISFRGQVAGLEERLAMYEAATHIVFGDMWAARGVTSFFAEINANCLTWSTYSSRTMNCELADVTRDDAIAKAFDLSKGAK